MADAEKKTLAKIGKLMEALRENQAQGYALVEEMNKLLAGGPGIAVLMKRLEGAFEKAWEGRYPGRYMWAFVKDRPQEKRLLLKLAIEDLEDRVANYLRDGDDYLVKHRHPFGVFVSQINRYAPAGSSELELDGEAPADCKHVPRCTTDVEHTRRRRQES